MEASEWQKCEIYQFMSNREGSLFRCKYDPLTEEALEKHWAGIWCKGNFGGDCDNEIKDWRQKYNK